MNNKSLKIGIIGLPGSWSSEHLADEIERQTGHRSLIHMEDVCFDLESDTIHNKGTELAGYDAFMIKKIGAEYSPDLLNRLEILTHLSRKGVRFFSDPARIMGLLDRMSCTLKLQQGKVPIPATVITENLEEGWSAVEDYGRAVLKPLYTSKARGMRIIEADNRGREEFEEFKAEGNKMLYIQKWVPLPGKDLGIVFLGNEYLATYARVAKEGSWNTTTNSGGKYEAFEPSQEIIDLAQRTQALFGLDFTCVDLVETDDGPKIFEVSAFGGFRGLKEANGIDGAELYVKHVLKELNHA